MQQKPDRRLADLRTGWPIFDDEFGGIPSKHAFISMPGKGHHGKTSVAVDLARRLIEFNPGVYDALVPKVFVGFCFVPLRRKATGCGEMKQSTFLHYSRPLYKDLGAYECAT